MSKEQKLRVLSLFSGCGGLDLGFEGDFKVFNEYINLEKSDDKDKWTKLPKTRFTTVFANDIRPDAKIAWTNYFKKYSIYSDIYVCESIVDLVKKHKSGQKVFPDCIDVVTGGFPCNDFSVSGKRQGLNSLKNHDGKTIEKPNIENRGQLYIWMKEVIELTQPKVFIAENVKGLVNLSDVKSIIENDFRSIGGDGYLVVNARVLHAADYGVPQSRERVIFIGFKKSSLSKKALAELSKSDINDTYDPYPPMTHSYTVEKIGLLPFTTVKQAFTGLQEPDKSNDKSQQQYSRAKFMGKHCQGQTEINLDSIGPTIRAEHHGNIEYRRLSLEHGGKYIKELRQGLIERRLTLRECARIQTFPDNYDFIIPKSKSNNGLSASNAYKLIGNAVPPLLGYHIAKRLDDNWDLYFGGK